MYSTSRSNRMTALALTSAMGAVLLSGCTTQGAPRADLAASKAETALAKGQTSKAIENAEAAVAADPRNAAYRAMLGAAYLEAGRFSSAVTSFDDAMALGDNSAGTALRIALALTGEGKYPEAVAVLKDWDDAIAPADLGLAYALAGQQQRGIQVMSNAIRAGDNTPKIRQNLAYAFALNGQWKEARLMAAEDVAADQIGDRIQEWAMLVQPEAWQHRVAVLLGAPAGVHDAGQPLRLALANTPSVQQLAAEAAAVPAAEPVELLAVAEPAYAELPAAVETRITPVAVEPSTRSSDFEAAFATVTSASETVARVAQDTVRFIQEPVVQALASRQEAAPATIRVALPQATPARAVPARYEASAKSNGSHLIQLGSFGSEQSARRAWDIYTKRYPELAGHQMVISEAVVSGKRYWRVSAGGFDNSSSRAMCGRVKSKGEGCIAYAESRPLPGAVDAGVRLASR